MGSHRVFLGALTVTAGTDSSVLNVSELTMARKLLFDCPAVFAGTVTVYVGAQDEALFAALKPLRLTPTAADVVLIANKFCEVECGGFASLAFKASVSDTLSIPVYAILEI